MPTPLARLEGYERNWRNRKRQRWCTIELRSLPEVRRARAEPDDGRRERPLVLRPTLVDLWDGVQQADALQRARENKVTAQLLKLLL